MTKKYMCFFLGQVRRLMFVSVNFLVKFNFFGHIHSILREIQLIKCNGIKFITKI